MGIKLQVLSEEKIKKVHDRTVRILEEAGVCVKSKRAREALLKAGAIAGEGEIIKIPETLLNKSLETAPKSFVLGARNPEYDFNMPAEKPGHILDGITTAIVDLKTGKRRPSNKADVTALGRVFQSLETGAVAWSGTSAMDKPPETHCLHEFAAILEGTSKHIQFELRHDGESPYAIEILRAILGSDEAIRQRKIASVLYCPISPLSHDDSMLDAYLALTDYEVPVAAYPMPIMGLTSPASVFSTLCQINAETLSALVIFQAVKPGLPVIYGSCSGSMDPMTGDYVDGQETVLLSMSAVEMARYYDLPCQVTGADYQTISTYLMWPDLIDGFGTSDEGTTSEMELMVVQDEVAKQIFRIMEGVDFGDDKDLTDDIISRGPQGSFISCKSTKRIIREGTEIYSSEVFPESQQNEYEDEDDPMWEIAHEYVEELLAGPVEDAIPAETLTKINEICNKADKNLAGV